MTSEEIASADALLAEVARLREQADYWRIQAQDTLVDLHAAEADAAALGEVLRLAQPDVCSLTCPSTWRTADGPPPHSDKCQAVSAALDQEHPGAALLAELDACRAVVRALRGIAVNWPPLTRALEEYDRVTKARDRE